jgi:hypothetical protein
VEIVITEWAFQSYIDLVPGVITSGDYWNTIRPDVELLRSYPSEAKFSLSTFWGPATVNGQSIPDGFKMKWHNIGPGRLQLRLAVATVNGVAYLCEAYSKTSPRQDTRMMARFESHIDFIRQGNFNYRGRL